MLEYYRTLMADSVRVSQFQRALETVLKRDDTVLDLGCGTGILALLALQLGARHVFAVDDGRVADAAELLANSLGVADRLTVLHQHSTTMMLDFRATLLITETLGMLGFDEGILGHVIDARNRLLAPHPRLVPNALRVFFVPLDSYEDYERHIAWWSTAPYDIDFSALRRFASNSILPATLDAATFLAEEQETIAVRLDHVTETACAGSASFIASRAGQLHGFGGWFRATLAPGIDLSSFGQETHWSQAFLPLEQPIEVTAGARITLNVDVHSNGRMWRWHGRVDGPSCIAFDQCSAFSAPPCTKHRGKATGPPST